MKSIFTSSKGNTRNNHSKQEQAGDMPVKWHPKPEELNEITFDAGVHGAYELVNPRGAVLGCKVTLARPMSHMTAFIFIGALTGLDMDTDLVTTHAPTRYATPHVGDILDKLGFNFPTATFAYFVTRNNETYMLLAGEEAVYDGENEDPNFCTTVCVFRVTPRIPWSSKDATVEPYSNVPVNEDMRHSYYGKKLVESAIALRDGTVEQMNTL